MKTADRTIVLGLFFICLNIGNLHAQNLIDSLNNSSGIVISPQAGFNSLTVLYFLPATQGISWGINFEKGMDKSGHIGLDYLFGRTLNHFEGDMHLKLQTFQFYYFKHSPAYKLMNQFGFNYTTFEYINSSDYLTFGDRYNIIGLLLGNNNIHIFKKQPRIKFGIQSNIGIYFSGYSQYRSTSYWIMKTKEFGLPYSFTYFTFKYLLFNPKAN